MSEIKSHEFDQFLQQRAGQYAIFILYGPDQGLVSERASGLAAIAGVDLNDPFSVVKLDGGDLQSDPGRLADETGSIGLFGGRKLVWVKGGGDKKIADAVSAITGTGLRDCVLIVEAGDLKKGAALRKIGESARDVALIACYSDDARALNALIDTELAAVGLGITPAGRALLLDSLGGDRIASRNEIRKLALYGMGMTVIDRDDILAIVGDASAVSIDDAVDAVLKGDSEALLHEIQKIATSKTSIFLVLQAALRQFQQLDIWAAEMAERRVPPAQVLQSSARGLHFRRKPIIEAALRNWPADAFAREAQRLQATILQTRQRAALEEAIAFNSLLSATLHAARFNRRTA